MIPVINNEPRRGATTINRSRYRAFVHIGFRLVSRRFKRDQTLSSCTSSRRFVILLWLAVRSCSFPRQFSSAKESKLLPLIFRISSDKRSFCLCPLFIRHRSHRVSSTGIAVFVARKRVFHLRAVVDSRYRSRWDEDIRRDLRVLGSDCHPGIVFLIWNNYRDSLVSGYDCFASTDGLDSRQNWNFQFCSRHYRTGRWQWEGGMVEWHPTRRNRKVGRVEQQ